jgi:DNA-binding HxlR family transcriptional regulator
MDIRANMEILSTLGNPTILEVFRKILRKRLLSHYELREDKIKPEQLEEALQKLQDIGLIDRTPASHHDFDKYYPTREGLAVEKIVQ